MCSRLESAVSLFGFFRGVLGPRPEALLSYLGKGGPESARLAANEILRRCV